MRTSLLPSVCCTAAARRLLDAHADDTAGAVGERLQVGLLDHALARAHHDELLIVFGEVADREQRGDLLAGFHRHEVGDCLAAVGRPDVGIS
jgi:hypothetical protein